MATVLSSLGTFCFVNAILPTDVEAIRCAVVLGTCVAATCVYWTVDVAFLTPQYSLATYPDACLHSTPQVLRFCVFQSLQHYIDLITFASAFIVLVYANRIVRDAKGQCRPALFPRTALLRLWQVIQRVFLCCGLGWLVSGIGRFCNGSNEAGARNEYTRQQQRAQVISAATFLLCAVLSTAPVRKALQRILAGAGAQAEEASLAASISAVIGRPNRRSSTISLPRASSLNNLGSFLFERSDRVLRVTSARVRATRARFAGDSSTRDSPAMRDSPGDSYHSGKAFADSRREGESVSPPSPPASPLPHGGGAAPPGARFAPDTPMTGRKTERKTGCPSELSSSAALTAASSAFRAIPFELLEATHFETNAASGNDLFHRTIQLQLGEVDFFLSHSWHDSARRKWEALVAYAKAFREENKGRNPLVWLDKACLNQENVAASLSHLPVHLAGCKGLVVLAGATYTSRIWTLLELFVWVAMGKRQSSIKMLVVEGDSDVEGQPSSTAEDVLRSFRTISVADAQCSSQRDRQKILAIIESSFTSLKAYDAHMAKLLLDVEGSGKLTSKVKHATASALHRLAGGVRRLTPPKGRLMAPMEPKWLPRPWKAGWHKAAAGASSPKGGTKSGNRARGQHEPKVTGKGVHSARQLPPPLVAANCRPENHKPVVV